MLHLTAASYKELNQQLGDWLVEPVDLPLDLTVVTPGWCATGWICLLEQSSSVLEISINGSAVQPTVLELAQQRYLVGFEPYWPDTHPLTEQQLRLRGGRLLRLECKEAISPWHLFQLVRPDVATNELQSSLLWLISHGLSKYNLLRQHQPLLEHLNQRESENEHTRLAHTLWQRADLQQAFGSIEAKGFADWLRHQAPVDHHWPELSPSGHFQLERTSVLPWHHRRFGVNLLGYANEAIGIGEDLRTCQLALEAAGVPVTVIDIPTQHCSTELRQQALHQADALAPYAFNLFCLTAEEHARIVLELGQAILQQRWNIGYWPWELSRWPKPWQPLLPMVDEIWASSRHTYAAISSALGERLQPELRQIPLPVAKLSPLDPEAREHWRRHFGLPSDLPLVICSFDGRSSYWRKNPWAALEAFQQAFPFGNALDLRLVIKTMHAGLDGEQWQQLQTRAQADPRLILIDGILPRPELLGLYGCCDVLLSLHRAEGYGRNLAEALLLGLEVVATNYSGNTDFCIGPKAHPVPYSLLPVQDGQYPHHEGQHWAEPCVKAASDILQQVIAQLGTNAATTHPYDQLFSAAAIGQRYRLRLQEIWWQRDQLTAQLRFQSIGSRPSGRPSG